MLTDETTDLARRYLEACYNDADYQTVEELAAPAFSVYYPAMQREVKGVAEWSEFLRAIRVGLPDLYVAYEHLATQKGTAVFSWETRGTHSGEFLCIAPTGRQVQWTGLTVVHVANGRILREWGEEDELSQLRQLGVIPA